MTPNKEAALRDLRHCIAVASLEQPGWRSTWEQALSDITTPDALTEAVVLLRRIQRIYSDMENGSGWKPTELRKVDAFLSRHDAERKGP